MNNEEMLDDIINDWPKKWENQIRKSFVNNSNKYGSFIISNNVYIWTIDEDVMKELATEKLFSFLSPYIEEYMRELYSKAIYNIIFYSGSYYVLCGFWGHFEETKNGILYFRKPIETKV